MPDGKNYTDREEKRALARKKAEALLEQMTLQEKVGQLNQRLYGFRSYERDGDEIRLSEDFCREVEKYSGIGVLYGLYRADPWSERTYENGLYGEHAVRAYNQAQRYVLDHSRLKIPMLMSTECPHGHQALGGYLLPVNLAAGASFDIDLYEQACRVCARQLKEQGVHLALVSMLDVLRDPRWGRSEECYSEDPYLCAQMAAAAVRGFQKEGVTVVAKHFAAQGETTGGTNASAARIGERELREIHLPSMQACCDEGVGGVMAAYNEIDGIYCHANPHLLKDILRDEMGFEGFVMADGIAVDNLASLTGSKRKAGALALRSGVDVSLWDEGFSLLAEAVEKGEVSEQEIDQAVLRVLTEKYASGVFDHPYLPDQKPEEYTIANHPESLKMAEESVVLLENREDILPFRGTERIAVIGPHSDQIYDMLGDYSPSLKEGEGITLLRGMQEAVKERYPHASVEYARGSGILKGTKEELEEAVALAERSDIVILTIGGSSSRFGGVTFDANGAARTDGEVSMDCGEGIDCASLEISPAQRALAEALYATGKPVIAVVVSGRPMILNREKECAAALLQCFYPGPAGGKALAEILFGEVNPSGVLPASLPRSTGQLPVYYNTKASYQAGVYYDVPRGALYPFGYGRSYTQFACTGAELKAEGELSAEALNRASRNTPAVRIDVNVKNTGSRRGEIPVLVYVRDLEASTVRRVRELKAFTRVALEPGEETTAELVLTADAFKIWDTRMERTAEPGNVDIFVELMGEIVWRDTITLA